MSLDTINKWFTLASNIGVVAGFVLLASQMSQNTQAIRLQNTQDQWRELSASESAFFGDTLYVAMTKALERPSDLTSEDIQQLWGYGNASLMPGYNVWNAYNAGAVAEND